MIKSILSAYRRQCGLFNHSSTQSLSVLVYQDLYDNKQIQQKFIYVSVIIFAAHLESDNEDMHARNNKKSTVGTCTLACKSRTHKHVVHMSY